MPGGPGRSEYTFGFNLRRRGKEHYHSCPIQKYRLISIVDSRHAGNRSLNNLAQTISL